MTIQERFGQGSSPREALTSANAVTYDSYGPAVEDVADFYQSKTQLILERYGPGPRVHYHTGLIDHLPRPHCNYEQLRQVMLNSQVRMFQRAAHLWRAPITFAGDVLDVGCGLGGGSIFWAERFGARVTALTLVPEHLELVMRFAREVGVGERIRPLLGDATEVPGEDCFDAAIAVESSLHIPRRSWMRRISGLLRPGGRLFIIDCFLGQDLYREPFNDYWCARIGYLDEYFASASEAGLDIETCDEISPRAANFFAVSMALIEAQRRQEGITAKEDARLAKSWRMHRFVHEGLLNGGLRYALLSFLKH